MGQTIYERFQEEINNINDYVRYIEDNFYRRSREIFKSQDVKDVDIEYIFFAETKEEKDDNQQIIDHFKRIVDSKVDECENKLSKMTPKELHEISDVIVENDLADSLINYIQADVFN